MFIYWIAVVTSTVPVFLLGRSVLFSDWPEFFDAIGYWFKPDILSAFHGDYWDDIWAEFKLGILITLTAGCGFLVHWKAGPTFQAWLGSVGLL